METEIKRCMICGGEMQEGFLLDFTHNDQKASRWVAGKPQKTLSGMVAFSDRPNYHVSAYRCTECAHLEFYAIDQPSQYPMPKSKLDMEIF